MKTRREFLQGLIISVGGASALSACGDAATIVATVLPLLDVKAAAGGEVCDLAQ